MLWDKLTEENYIIYVNRDIDLRIKVFELMENDEIYINYKGFNLTIPMLVWEFGEDLKLASIEDVRMEGNDRFELKQWKIVDPQSVEVTVSLYDAARDLPLDENLFKFKKGGSSPLNYKGRKK